MRSTSQRSLGTSVTASTPRDSRLQNASGESAPPGKRHDMPMMATGSVLARCAAASRASSSLMATSERLRSVA